MAATKITDEEIKEYFTLVDSENAGKLRRDQIDILLRALGHTPTKAEMEKLDQLDLDNCLKKLPRNRTPISKEAIQQAVAVINGHYPGGVSKDALKSVITQVGDKLSEKEFEEFVRDMEFTPDGKLKASSVVTALTT